MTWITAHWVTVALVASEVMAFLPSKYTGIVKTVINIGNAIFGKKS